MPNLMVEQAIRRAAGDTPKCVLDLGYTKEEATQRRFKSLRRFGIGYDNFSVEGFGRLLVLIPARKVAKLLAAFPIEARSTYYGATHSWLSEPPEEPGGK